MARKKKANPTKPCFVDWDNPTVVNDEETTYPINAANTSDYIQKSENDEAQAEIGNVHRHTRGNEPVWKYTIHANSENAKAEDSSIGGIMYLAREEACIEALDDKIRERGYYLDQESASKAA